MLPKVVKLQIELTALFVTLGFLLILIYRGLGYLELLALGLILMASSPFISLIIVMAFTKNIKQ